MIQETWSKVCCRQSISAGLQAEMDVHLGYGHSDCKTKAQVATIHGSNHRNGAYTKTINSGYGALEGTVPRDRAGTFTPQIVPKGTRRLTVKCPRFSHLLKRNKTWDTSIQGRIITCPVTL